MDPLAPLTDPTSAETSPRCRARLPWEVEAAASAQQAAHLKRQSCAPYRSDMVLHSYMFFLCLLNESAYKDASTENIGIHIDLQFTHAVVADSGKTAT